MTQAEHDAKVKEVAPATTPEEAIKQNTVPRFRIGSLVPINGVWFKIARIEKEGLFLEAVAYTGKEKKR